ncbi:MAG: phage major capsid protein, partial [Opitutae bacterium]
LIEGLGELGEVQKWVSDGASSVAAEADVKADRRPHASTVGGAFVDSPEFKDLQGGRNGFTMRSPFELKSLLTKDVYGGLPGPGGAGDFNAPEMFGGVERDGIVQLPQRSRRVRDLFPARTTNAAVVEYFRQTGYVISSYASAQNTPRTINSNAAGQQTDGWREGTQAWASAYMVPERNADNTNFGAKPKSSLSFVGQQAPVRTIAHWEAAHRNVLSDEPQLRGIIDNELLYGLRLMEDQQILNGSGTSDELNGILNDTNIQSYIHPIYAPDYIASAATPTTADTKADAVRRALTLAYLANYEPTGVIVNPMDWEDIELTKNSQGTYLLAMSVAAGAEQRVWRVPVIDTPAIAQGTALVGAFGTGAQLYDREAASIRISENYDDFFTRNAIVILAEERLALAVKRPESFVQISFQ